MDKKFLLELLEAIDRSSVTSLEINDPDGTRIKLKKEGVHLPAVQPVQTLSISSPEIPSKTEPVQEGNIIKSPIVGTVYLSPSPGEPPFVSPGTVVSKGDILCIVEAMKMMNEIESEYSGKVSQVLVENGELVEYGQPLMIID